MIKPFQYLLLSSVLLSVSMFSHSAGFNCNKATTWIAKSICKDSELSKLDEQMTDIYQQKLANDTTDSTNYIKAEQRQWLKYHRNTCKTLACLKREYQEYIKLASNTKLNLTDVVTNENQRPNSDKFGKFIDDTEISVYQNEELEFEQFDVGNTLTLDRVENKVNIAVLTTDLLFTNAHTCSIENAVVYWSENHWKLQDYDIAAGCELRIYPSKNKILLQDINNQCRQLMCGMRGGFNGLIFQKD